ncbi:MAG: Lrp/AsnC family transcriptional regulator, partial [Bdellovibrionales bacterium]|nr:Lrp/AsnC family transcriptional regulator [Bdellovibrionales bacterium]
MSTERSSRGTSVLSDSDRTILLLTQNHAEKSISSLKDTVDVSEHQLRRAITRFKQLGLYKPLPIVNLSIIGYSRYQVLFSITQYAQQHIVTFKKRLTEHPLIYFFCEIGGDFQYMIGIHAKNLKELDDCLSSISKEFQGAFAERDILPVIEMSFLGTGLLCPRLPRDTPVTWKDQGGSL